ncbi:MAG: hypothetical protein KDA96_14970 [Planctomycetaceae bacterium]|nr:hypothetical protein [Planctomycetaceae bacterium]
MTTKQPQDLTTFVRTLRIITFALMNGLVLFLVIVLFLTGGALNEAPSILTWISLGFGVLMFVNHLVIPNIVGNSALAQVTADKLKELNDEQRIMAVLPAFQVRHIVACALLEGAGFLGLVCAMLEKNWIPMVVGGVMAALIAIRFPSESNVRFWAEDRIRERMM